jgi:hypothetical protein
MPHIIRLFSAQETSVNFIVIMRILHGAFQGMVSVEFHTLLDLKKMETNRRGCRSRN